MLFPEDALFGYVLADLAETLQKFSLVAAQPLPCDRYVARSALQKTIRRGEVGLAQRALANLYAHDPATVWRHLIIICLEDVGVANVDLLAQVIAAKRDRRWRMQMGGEWQVMAGLVRLMAESVHCQAACDLLLRVTNDPELDKAKAEALEAEPGLLAEITADPAPPIEQRGVAAMALAGCLAEGQRLKDPCGVFDVMAEQGHFSHVVATCRAAWKISRNPMALLLPLVWPAWTTAEQLRVEDDAMPAVQLISGVPGYALDQFTRVGNTISRGFLRECEELRNMFEAAGVRPGEYTSTLGDLIFLTDGGRVCRRIIWPTGDCLRLPHRQLPAVARLGSHLDASLRLVDAKGRQLAKLRATHYHSSAK